MTHQSQLGQVGYPAKKILSTNILAFHELEDMSVYETWSTPQQRWQNMLSEYRAVWHKCSNTFSSLLSSVKEQNARSKEQVVSQKKL